MRQVRLKRPLSRAPQRSICSLLSTDSDKWKLPHRDEPSTVMIIIPELLNVGRNSRESVDSVDNTSLLDELGAMRQNARDCEKREQKKVSLHPAPTCANLWMLEKREKTNVARIKLMNINRLQDERVPSLTFVLLFWSRNLHALFLAKKELMTVFSKKQAEIFFGLLGHVISLSPTQ